MGKTIALKKDKKNQVNPDKTLNRSLIFKTQNP